MPPSVHAVVLNWNGYHQTKKCLVSLQQQEYDNLTIWLVDNNSTDQSIKKLRDEFPEVEFIESDINRGFAGGMNLGITSALDSNADYIWLLNNDVTFPNPEVLCDLVNLLGVSEASVLTPTILDQDGDVWFERGEINRSTGSASHVSTESEDTLSDLQSSDYIPYCAALFEYEVFANITLIPEDYFMYYEDVDHCFTLGLEGIEIAVATDVYVTHAVSSTSGSALEPLQTYYTYRNLLLFITKYMSSLRKISPLYYIIHVLYGICRRIYRRRLGSIKPLLLGVLHGLRGSGGRGPYP